jgi:hypothetical protein
MSENSRNLVRNVLKPMLLFAPAICKDGLSLSLLLTAQFSPSVQNGSALCYVSELKVPAEFI